MTTIRNDVFKIGENFVTLIGDEVKVGDVAPDFTSVVAGWLKVNPLRESKGKVIILSAVPSLDTDVCDRETRRFNEEATGLGDHVVVLTVSADLPMAQSRWCGAAGVDKVKMLSDYVDMAFGQAYGTWVEELRLDQRAIFIVDSQDVVRYAEYVPAIPQHPNYDAALAALKQIA